MDSSDLWVDPGTGMRELLGLGVLNGRGKEKKKRSCEEEAVDTFPLHFGGTGYSLECWSKRKGEWTLGVKVLVAHGVG